MCKSRADGGRRCIAHHPGTRVSLALVRATHPEITEEQSSSLVRRLNREATAAGMRSVPANPDQVEALLDKMHMDLEFFTIEDSSYRDYCFNRLEDLRKAYHDDPTCIDEAKLHVWRYLPTAAGAEVTRRTRSNPKRIGVDLDGVVYDCHAIMNQYMAARGYEVPEEQMRTYSLAAHYGVDVATVQEEFRNAVKFGVMFRHGEALPDGATAVQRLYEDGHQIVIITARDLPGMEDECRAATVRWLRDNAIPFDELHLTGEKEKVDVDVLLDDAPGNVDRVVGHGTEGVVIDRPFNRLEGAGHARRSWADVVRELTQPENEDVLFSIEPQLSDAAREREIPLGGGSDAGPASVA